jgi:hypothetical protein
MSLTVDEVARIDSLKTDESFRNKVIISNAVMKLRQSTRARVEKAREAKKKTRLAERLCGEYRKRR